METKKIKTIVGASFIAVLMHSFCCIVPLVVVLGGISGAASTLSWIEPAEPYLIGFSVVALSIAFYQVYKPKKKIDCECDHHDRKNYLGSKAFLWSTTAFTVVMYILHHFTDVFGHVH
ncbi:MAG: hypothetical protein CL840_20620 [Crocinitomicaceae bacterium]|nr:hypothetical protein [Crocinitomicaceae bacterium]|tara:strand:+ start:5902 stop:6255 length:354 start_codon:yes stop_codon:yes gene_type:complete